MLRKKPSWNSCVSLLSVDGTASVWFEAVLFDVFKIFACNTRNAPRSFYLKLCIKWVEGLSISGPTLVISTRVGFETASLKFGFNNLQESMASNSFDIRPSFLLWTRKARHQTRQQTTLLFFGLEGRLWRSVLGLWYTHLTDDFIGELFQPKTNI